MQKPYPYPSFLFDPPSLHNGETDHSAYYFRISPEFPNKYPSDHLHNGGRGSARMPFCQLITHPIIWEFSNNRTGDHLHNAVVGALCVYERSAPKYYVAKQLSTKECVYEQSTAKMFRGERYSPIHCAYEIPPEGGSRKRLNRIRHVIRLSPLQISGKGR